MQTRLADAQQILFASGEVSGLSVGGNREGEKIEKFMLGTLAGEEDKNRCCSVERHQYIQCHIPGQDIVETSCPLRREGEHR